MKSELRETLFNFRTPTDTSSPDIVAYYDVPKGINYNFAPDDNYTILLPAKAYATFTYTAGETPSISVDDNSSDLANVQASVESTTITISVKFKSFVTSDIYGLDMLAFFCKSDSSPITYTYNSSTNTFSYTISKPTSSSTFTHYYYYIPRDANYYLVLKEDVGGTKIESEVASASVMAFTRYYNDPRSTPKLKGVFVREKATIAIKAVSRLRLLFDPLLPNLQVCPLVFINIPVIQS